MFDVAAGLHTRMEFCFQRRPVSLDVGQVPTRKHTQHEISSRHISLVKTNLWLSRSAQMRLSRLLRKTGCLPRQLRDA